MGRLCFGTYAKLLQKTLAADDNKHVVSLLLGLIIDNEDVRNQHGEPFDVSDKHASRLLNHKDNLRKKIKDASGTPKIINAARDYFDDVVIPEIMPDLVADLIADLRELIMSDVGIPKRKQTDFLALGDGDSLAEFLAKVFLYAIKKPNKLYADKKGMETSDELLPLSPARPRAIPESDIYLLLEANSVCPSCGKPLVNDKNNHSLPGYAITPIIPLRPTDDERTELGDLINNTYDPETNNNKIALCLECANRYKLHTTKEECRQLLDTKDSLRRNFDASVMLNKMYLEEQIEAVLRQIPFASAEQLSDTLEYNALRIKEKISSNVPLIIKTQGFVVQYYTFIKSVFSQMEREGILNFEDVANDVQRSYRKLSSIGLKQEEIFTQLVEWFKKKGKARSSLACEIIVAFFVQNCEVFHALTQ